MPRRSVLFTPGDRPEMMRKAPGAGADVVVFDLEDAVAPSRKDEARAAVRAVLTDPEFDPDCEVCVRVNPVGTVADDDLAGLTENAGGRSEQLRLDSVMLPKVSEAGDVEHLDSLLAEHDFTVPVLAIVESAAGILHAEGIATEDATDALVFGAEDLSADIGATRTDEGTEVCYPRQHVVLAASAAGVDAIDTVYTDFEDEVGLVEATGFAVQLGYDGKMAIHPAQVGPINDAYTPSEDQLEWAERVLAARDEAAAEGRGVFRVADEMIDAPLIARAERIVERADAADIR